MRCSRQNIDIGVAHELEDSITDINISFTNIVRLRKQYLKAFEKYDEIEDEDKRDILRKTLGRLVQFRGRRRARK